MYILDECLHADRWGALPTCVWRGTWSLQYANIMCSSYVHMPCTYTYIYIYIYIYICALTSHVPCHGAMLMEGRRSGRELRSRTRICAYLNMSRIVW